MKWHPINDGDLSGIPKYEYFLFTIDDERGVKPYVICGEVRGNIEDLFVWGEGYCYEAKNVKAWMELPPPFKPNDCNRCAHWRVWIDGFGDRWSKCELMDIVPFVPLKKCPLKK